MLAPLRASRVPNGQDNRGAGQAACRYSCAVPSSITCPPQLLSARRQCGLALLLLLVAGFRHHLVWGESDRLPFNLRPWLDAGETACLLGFAWFGARGWLAAIAAVRERTPGIRVLVRLSLPLLLLGVLAPPFLSADVADYVMRGRVLSLHGGNPYVNVAAEYPADPFVAFGDAAWKQFPLPYGPLVAELQGALAWLGASCTFLPARAQFLVSVGLFKAVFAGCLLACALLARRLHQRLRVGDGDVAFLAVLWCPLLLNEALASAHNEALLLLTILLAIEGALRSGVGAGAFALGLGTLTKIVPVLLAPPLLAMAIRLRRVGAFACGVAGATAVLALEWWRFFLEPGAREFLQRQSEFTASSVVWALANVLGVAVAPALVVGRVVVVVVLAITTLRIWREPTAPRLVHGAASVLATMACCGLAGFGPWYHVWWVPLALLTGPGYLQRFACAVTFLSPLGYGLWTFSRELGVWHQALVFVTGIGAPALLALAKRLPAPA